MEDIKTVHYATKDPIKNLRIRVTLSKVCLQRQAPSKAAGTSHGGLEQHPALAEGESRMPPPDAQPIPQNFIVGHYSNPGGPPQPPTPPPGPAHLNSAAPGPAPAQQGPAPVQDPFQAAQAQQTAGPGYREGSALPMYDPALASQAASKPQVEVVRSGPLGEATEPGPGMAPGAWQPAPQPYGAQQPGNPGPFPPPPPPHGGFPPPPAYQQAGQMQYPMQAGQLQYPMQAGQMQYPMQAGQMQYPLQPGPGSVYPGSPTTTQVMPLSPHSQPPHSPSSPSPPWGPPGPFNPGPAPGPYLSHPPQLPTYPPYPAQHAYPQHAQHVYPQHAQHPPPGVYAAGGTGLPPPPPPPPGQPPSWGPRIDPSTGLPIAPPVIIPIPDHHPQTVPQQPGLYPGHLPPPLPPGIAVPAGGKSAATATTTQKLEVSRVFSWQEKVHSVSEVTVARQQMQLQGPGQQDDLMGPGDAGGLRNRRGRKRLMALGAQTAAAGQQAKSRVDPGSQGSVLFTYVHSDEFAEREELSKTVTTSSHEQYAPVYKRLMASAKLRQEVLSFRTMYIMADLGGDDALPHSNEVVLVAVKAFPDGSFDMRPGFSRPGRKYRFEDERGSIYEYTVEDVSAKAEPTLAKRTVVLQRQVAARAAELRALSLGGGRFQPPPADRESMRLVMLGEIMGCADFHHDHLYVEYVLSFDPNYWEMTDRSWAAVKPGIYQGVTAVVRVRLYPADHATATPERWVGHWGHPLEAELVSLGTPPPNKYPVLLFQVCSLDHMNRYSSQGYAWTSLADACPGSSVNTLKCWRPLQSSRDRHQEFFIGGSQELNDLSFVERGPLAALLGGSAHPGQGLRMGEVTPGVGPAGAGAAPGPKVLSKYGFRTETTGCIKVRLHCITQQWCDTDTSGVPDTKACSDQGPPAPAGLPGTAGGAPPGSSPQATARALAGGGGGGAKAKHHLSLAAVVDRARNRLRDARGGDVMVRPGLVSEAPSIRSHPVDARVCEGQVVHFQVTATGMEPLRYQWFKDDVALAVATSDTPSLFVAEVSPLDAGTYYCQVTNKDGSVVSNKAGLKVDKLSRVNRAVGENRSVASYNTRGSTGVSGRLAPVRASRLQTASTRVNPAGAAPAGQLPPLQPTSHRTSLTGAPPPAQPGAQQPAPSQDTQLTPISSPPPAPDGPSRIPGAATPSPTNSPAPVTTSSAGQQESAVVKQFGNDYLGAVTGKDKPAGGVGAVSASLPALGGVAGQRAAPASRPATADAQPRTSVAGDKPGVSEVTSVTDVSKQQEARGSQGGADKAAAAKKSAW